MILARRNYCLSARKDQVNAKGKGLPQTYWLDTKRSKTSGSVVSSIDEFGTAVDD